MPWGWGRRSWVPWNRYGGGGGKKKKEKKKKKTAFNQMRNYMYDGFDHLDALMGTTGMFGDLPIPSVNYVDHEEEINAGYASDGDDASGDVMVGTLRGNIVGIRFYSGGVNNGEMVSLVREPNNNYDKNAIRVLNADGVQVGHVKRELAAPLASLMDSSLVRVEGVVPSGSHNAFSMPVDLTLWSHPDQKQMVMDKMRYSGYYLKDASPASNSSSASASYMGGPSRTYISPSDMKNELDKLFENLDEGDKTKIMEPSKAIATPLFPHQKQALNWMVSRENSNKLPPFWEERKKGKEYFNTLTVFSSSRRPASVKGGILADDMGLGKTLEMIALIMTNFVDGKRIAEPVPGTVRKSRLAKKQRMTMYRQMGEMQDRAKGKKVHIKSAIARKRAGYDSAASMSQESEGESEGEASESLGEEDTSDDDVMEISEKTMMNDDDPSFSPDVAKKKTTFTVQGSPNICHRPRRSVKVTRYTFSSEDDVSGDELPVITPTKAKPSNLPPAARFVRHCRPSNRSGPLIAYIPPCAKTPDSKTTAKTNTPRQSPNFGTVPSTWGPDDFSNPTEEDFRPTMPNTGASHPTTTQPSQSMNSGQIPSQPTPSPGPSTVLSDCTEIIAKGPMQVSKIPEKVSPEFGGSVTTVVSAGGVAMKVNVSVSVVKKDGQEVPVSKKDIADQVVKQTKDAAESICRTVLMDYAGESQPDEASVSPEKTGTPEKDGVSMTTPGSSRNSTPEKPPGTPRAQIFNDVQVVTGVFSGGPVTPEKAEGGRPRCFPSPNIKTRPRRSTKKPTRYASSESETDDKGDENDEDYNAKKKKSAAKKRPKAKQAKGPAKKKQKKNTTATCPVDQESKENLPKPPVATGAPLPTYPSSATLPTRNANPLSTAASGPPVTNIPHATSTMARVPLPATIPNLPTATASAPSPMNIPSQPSTGTSLPQPMTCTVVPVQNFSTNGAKSLINALQPTRFPSAVSSSVGSPATNPAQPSTTSTSAASGPSSADVSYTPKSCDPPLPSLPDFAIKSMRTPTKAKGSAASDPISIPDDDDELPDLGDMVEIDASSDMPQPNIKHEEKPFKKGKAKGKKKNLAFCKNSNVLPDLDDVTQSESESTEVTGETLKFDPVEKFGALSGRTQTDKPRGTLIICPLSVLSNWIDQLDEHVRDSVHLAICMYYGPQRCRNANLLAKYDIVLTTYSTLTSDSKTKNNPLKKVKWLRLVLDEGHCIRNPSAQQTLAVLELKAERKWVLTGTPIQNSMKDFYSLVNFLQITPFTDRQWWNRTIMRPLGQGSQSALKRVQLLMASIALRRTKTQKVDGKPLVELTKKDIFIEHVELTKEERELYDAMHNDGKLIVSKYFRQGTLLRHYGQILAILLRLRQLCCHPFLLKKAARMASLDMTLPANGTLDEETRKKLVDTLLMVLTSGADEECSICLDTLKSAVITPCAHVYCRVCIETVITNEGAQAACPLCRGAISKDKLLDVPPEDTIDTTDEVSNGEWHSSTKIDALMKALIDLRAQDPTIKSMVVSQFTSFLNVIETPLIANGFKFVRFDGTMSQKQRTAAIETFSDNFPDSPTIFLMSLKAGGVGVNLTAASRVFMMDPAWNPAAEDQCYDRVHRLGQKRDVVVTRFVVKESVEERMLELQDKKRMLMQGAFEKKPSAAERRQARINDIRSLMDL